jgi:hypothetical protein
MENAVERFMFTEIGGVSIELTGDPVACIYTVEVVEFGVVISEENFMGLEEAVRDYTSTVENEALEALVAFTS